MREPARIASERPSSALAWVALAIACVIGCLFLANPLRALALGDSDTEEGLYSFYYVDGMASIYYEQSMTGVMADESGTAVLRFPDFGTQMADAGGLMGFADSIDDSWFGLGAFFSQLSNGAAVYSYDGFPAGDTDSGGVTFDNFRAYGVYGRLLGQLGLDETADIGGNAILLIVRFFMGALLIIPYALASFVDLAFLFAVKLLQQLNPFMLFSDLWSTIADSGTMEAFRTGPFGPIVSFVGGLYRGAIDFAWAVSIPVLFLAVICGYLFTHTRTGARRPAGASVRNLIVKVAFIGLALPILGGAYTGFLEMVEDLLTEDSGQMTNSNYVLYSTLVDFSSWADNTHLALPDGAEIVGGPEGGVDWANTTPPRLLAQYVNGVAGYTTGDDYHIAQTDVGAVSDWATSVARGFTFITEYMTSKDYNETDFETNWKGLALNGSSTGDEGAKTIYEGFEAATKMETYTDAEAGLTMLSSGSTDAAKYVYFWDGDTSSLDGVPDGGDPTLSGKTKATAYRYSGSRDPSTMGVTPSAPQVRDGSARFGLSTMSMYNYLRSSFGDDSFTCYSSEKISTALSRVSHKAVTAVGDPMNRLTNILSSAFELTALAVVGWGYAFGLIFAVVTRGIKIITGLPGAMMGSMKHMVKLVLYVAVMAVEIIVTIALYALVSQFILVINDMFAFNVLGQVFDAVGSGFGAVVDGVGADATGSAIDWSGVVASAQQIAMNASTKGSGGPIVDLVMAIASSVVSILFIFKAFSMRKKILATATSSVEDAVNGLFDRAKGNSGPASMSGNVSGGAGGGLGSTLARGAAAGLGMGAGQAVGRAVGGAIVDGAKDRLGIGSGSGMDEEGAAEVNATSAPALPDGGAAGEEGVPSGERLAESSEPLSAVVAGGDEGQGGAASATGGGEAASADVRGGHVEADPTEASTRAEVTGDAKSEVDGQSAATAEGKGADGVRGAQVASADEGSRPDRRASSGPDRGAKGASGVRGPSPQTTAARGGASGTDYTAAGAPGQGHRSVATTPAGQRRGDAIRRQAAGTGGWTVIEGGKGKTSQGVAAPTGGAIPSAQEVPADGVPVPSQTGFSMGGSSSSAEVSDDGAQVADVAPARDLDPATSRT